MRPVGGWLLGIFSDRYGRKAALGLTILMMAGGSLIIAVTPPTPPSAWPPCCC